MAICVFGLPEILIMWKRLFATTASAVLALGPVAPVLAQSSNDSATARTSRPTSGINLATLFHQLDTDHNDLLSRQEAAAEPAIAKAYDSFDTDETIQQPARNAHAGGITFDQFQAGMAAARDSGAFGPAASGGERYLVYPDGTRVPLNPSDQASP